MPPRVPALLLTVVLLAVPAEAEDPAPFDVVELPSPGRSAAAEFADLDGDGRTDLLEIALLDFPPEERRRIRVRFQTPDGDLPARVDLDLPLPPGSAVYDLAALEEDGTPELLLLGRRGITRLSLRGREPRLRLVRAPDGETLAAAPDERGLDRLPLVTRALGPGPHLVVPGPGETFLLAPDGTPRAQLVTPGRSNYFLQPPGLLVAESDIQIYHDAARVLFGDVDGDGRTDVVTATRHVLRTFLQREDGSFPETRDQEQPLRRVSPEDHVRGSGTVRCELADLDGDGRADLVVADVGGGLLDARATTSLHLNRAGGWDLDAPDGLVETPRAVTALQLLDFDGDGRLEILQVHVPVTVFELVEVLLTRAVDVHLRLFAPDAEGRLGPARLERKLGIPLSFETGRSRGFLPNLRLDLNGDGLPDLLTSGDGGQLEVFLGGPEGRFAQRIARQAMDTEGRVRGGDLDRDGLADLVIFNPRRTDAPLRVVRNRGILPGAPARLEARDREAGDRGD